MSKRNGRTRMGTSRSPDRLRSASSRSAASMGRWRGPELQRLNWGGRELAQYFQRSAARRGRE